MNWKKWAWRGFKLLVLAALSGGVFFAGMAGNELLMMEARVDFQEDQRVLMLDYRIDSLWTD